MYTGVHTLKTYVSKIINMLVEGVLVKTGAFLIEVYMWILASPFFIFDIIIGEDRITPKPS